MKPVQTLTGKQVVVAVTGSIAAVEVVKLVHMLRRRGAEVQTVMSIAATGIITADALTYASGRQAITRLSGQVEHVTWCGDEGSADLLLIAPCTANTLSKIACGIDDTPVTTFASTALGSGIPVVIVPAMHHSMYRHPAVQENIARLLTWGVVIIEPCIEEGKAKIAGNEEIILWCERAVLGRPLQGKRVLITSGPCREPVDDVRVLTTRSSGQMGRALALQAFRLGADVTVVHRDTFPCVENVRAESAAEMRDAVLRILAERGGTDIYISAAAISDFAPVQIPGKIPSGKPVSLNLEPLPKLLDEVLDNYAPLSVAFKLGTGQEKKALSMLQQGIALVLMNTPPTMGSEYGEFEQLSASGRVLLKGTKDEISRSLWEEIVRQTSPS
jgi:phosphopantothenoylcysteine decarboxylase/phosphopantothenate--cysteine ligase